MFQSTHSLRSATNSLAPKSIYPSCFNPRTPCGVRQQLESVVGTEKRFQSTHSLRSATKSFSLATSKGEVSIHALLAECDSEKHVQVFIRRSFNPRTPCGVRPVVLTNIAITLKFQSTHSLRSATQYNNTIRKLQIVSIHALLAECDLMLLSSLRSSTWFQSTHSLRSATFRGYPVRCGVPVSIHALLAECDRSRPRASFIIVSFNPRTPCGVRPVGNDQRLHGFGFNPRTPCGVRLPAHGTQPLGKGFNPRTPCGVRLQA